MTRKMKDSGIEWIGEIPEEWEITKGKYVYKIETGKLDVNASDPDGEYPFFTCSAVPMRINQYAFDTEALMVVGNGDIGTTMYYNGKFNAYQRTYVLSQFEKINPILLKHFVENNLANYASFKAVGSVIKFIKYDDLSNFSIVNPPTNEQEKISDFLDKKTDQIENIKSTIIKEIQTLENYEKSVITEAVTKGLDKNVEMKDSGVEWIGEIPKHWDLIKLKFIAQSISKGISPHYVEETLTPVVNQATFSKGFFDSNLKYCSEKPIGEGLLKMNDVLLATTGGGVLGKTYYFEEKGKYLASTDVAYIRNKDKYISKFIYYILSVNYDLLNGIFAKGSTNQTHLQMDLLSNMHIPLPNQNELSKIISKLDVVNTNINDSIAIKQKQLETLEEYKKSLIYEYVTGKKEVKDGEET